MNLDELSQPITASLVNKQINKQFGTKLQITKLNLKESIAVLNRSNTMLDNFKLTENNHTSQNNKNYMKSLMISEAVFKHASHLAEFKGSEMNKAYTSALKIAAMGGKLSEAQIKSLRVSPKMGKVLESQKKSQLFMRKIVESKKARKALNESEIADAQTTLAAQDIADQIQGMIEKFADIKYKELPALHDSIRNAQGVESAEAFNTSLTASLEELTGSLESAKGEVNNAVAILTGQEVSDIGGDIDLDGLEGEEDGELDMDLDFDDDGLGGDMGMDDEMGGDDFDMDLEDEEDIDLGRARR